VCNIVSFAGPIATIIAAAAAVFVTWRIGQGQLSIAKQQATIAKQQAELARAQAGRGRRPAHHLLLPWWDLLATLVKGLIIMVNSSFNGNRREDIWLDR
jgi:ABC-type Fe3+ transport system permease subunit